MLGWRENAWMERDEGIQQHAERLQKSNKDFVEGEGTQEKGGG